MGKPRSWERWNDVFADMTKRGANGTDEQLELVTRIFPGESHFGKRQQLQQAEELGWEFSELTRKWRKP